MGEIRWECNGKFIWWLMNSFIPYIEWLRRSNIKLLLFSSQENLWKMLPNGSYYLNWKCSNALLMHQYILKKSISPLFYLSFHRQVRLCVWKSEGCQIVHVSSSSVLLYCISLYLFIFFWWLMCSWLCWYERIVLVVYVELNPPVDCVDLPENI